MTIFERAASAGSKICAKTAEMTASPSTTHNSCALLAWLASSGHHASVVRCMSTDSSCSCKVTLVNQGGQAGHSSPKKSSGFFSILVRARNWAQKAAPQTLILQPWVSFLKFQRVLHFCLPLHCALATMDLLWPPLPQRSQIRSIHFDIVLFVDFLA